MKGKLLKGPICMGYSLVINVLKGKNVLFNGYAPFFE